MVTSGKRGPKAVYKAEMKFLQTEHQEKVLQRVS